MSAQPAPSVGRIVLYRTHGGYDFAAMIVATANPDWSEPLPEGHVHLRIFTPPFGVPEPVDELYGTPFANGLTEPPAGTWRWPERV